MTIANLELAVAGLILGATVAGGAAVAIGVGRRRGAPAERAATTEPLAVVVLAVAVAGVAAAWRAAPWVAVPTAMAGAAIGGAIGAGVGGRARIRSVAVLGGALATTAVGYLLLPDTEGTMLVGGALVVPTAVAALRPRRWTSAPAVAAVGAIVGLLVPVAVLASAERWSTLAASLATAVAVTAMVVVTAHLLTTGRLLDEITGPRPEGAGPVTSEPGPPSRSRRRARRG